MICGGKASRLVPLSEKAEMIDFVRFMAIFEGLDIAYGTYKVEKSRGDGKQNGKAVVVRQPPTKDLWVKHIQGVEPSLGIIPIRADNTCTWGCIDIDQYPLDHKGLVEKIQELQMPLVVCRSKSGGAHVFCFTSGPVQASDMRTYLNACAAILGESGREVFPKQSEILVERGDTGNFLNLPYFGGDETLRYAIKPDGSAATLEEFFRLYDDAVQGPPLTPPETPSKPEQPIKDGPPCLQTLCARGFPEGTRNNGLFNIGIYLKRTGTTNWEDKLAEHNQKYFGPPLGLTELQ
ncbi:MAG: hypothetical protein EBZ49_17070, partial [Proteobacteria bacterium]|nr:hypothetical protein [Pseudomonadota bacterium]